MQAHHFMVALVSFFLLCSGCAESEEGEPTMINLEILSIDYPDPVIEGTLLSVESRGVNPSGAALSLTLTDRTTGELVATLSQADVDQEGTFFEVDATLTQSLGAGVHNMEAVLHQGEGLSHPYGFTFQLAQEIMVFVDDEIRGTHFRNDKVIISGDGFISPREGSVVAEVVGDFESADGSSSKVVATLPFELVETQDRGRGMIRLTTALGGLGVGTFSGTYQVVATMKGGFESTSNTLPLEVSFVPPALFNYGPDDPYLGQIVVVQGGGFLGGPEDFEQDEATVLVFEGEIEDPSGQVEAFGPSEMAVVYLSGEEVTLGIDADELEGSLVSSFFGVKRGTFRGEVTPVVLKGSEDLSGDPVPLEMKINGVRQNIVVVFLPSFYNSLHYFGLAAAANQVVDQAMMRMQGIYEGYDVAFLTEAPEDFLPSAVAMLEIGGPDPNGLGLFGYDNTPGKDVGNLRLFDSIGGANAKTQADNYPGYGGVFIDSFMMWSSHPEDLDRGMGPEQDPLFDEIFDPVRANPATLEEAEGGGDVERVNEVQRAIRTMGSIIGETSAHEVGHSLGLAQPFGSLDAYHSAFPGEGCLMDSGSDRPFGERAMEAGYSSSVFCGDEPLYLEEILGR